MNTLLERILEQKTRLTLQERFYVEKLNTKTRPGLQHRSRLIRIAQKIGIDLREK